jgi:hypothetical protein
MFYNNEAVNNTMPAGAPLFCNLCADNDYYSIVILHANWSSAQGDGVAI